MFLCPHQIIWKINELYVKIDSTNVVYFGNTWIKIWDLVCPLLLIFMFLHSVLQGISPTLKYWAHPFLPSPPPPTSPKNLNLSPPPPPFPFPSKSWRTWLPCPWDVHLSKTQKIHFLIKKNNSNNEMRAHLNVEIWIYSCKT